jgi:membrane protease YdiL (CAAX protease family)
MKRAEERTKGAVLLFVVVAFAVSWTISEVYYRLIGATPAGNVIMSVAFMYGPAVGAIIAVRWGLGQRLKWLGPVFRWSPWLIVAALAPLVFAIAHGLVAAALPQIELATTAESLARNVLQSAPDEQRATVSQQLERLGPDLPLILLAQLLFGGLLAGITINAIGAFGEELGWRGFMHRALESRGFWKSSAIIGVVWGLWHTPLILRGHNYPEHPQLGVAMMVAFCVLLSPLFAHVRERAGSVLAATFMHGTLNATGGVLIFLSGGNDLLKGPAGLPGMLVLLAANGWLWAARRKRTASAAAAAAPET